MNPQQGLVLRTGGYSRGLERAAIAAEKSRSALTKTQMIANQRRINLLGIYGEVLLTNNAVEQTLSNHGDVFHLDLPPFTTVHTAIDDSYAHTTIRLSIRRYAMLFKEILDYTIELEKKAALVEAGNNSLIAAVKPIPGFDDVSDELFLAKSTDDELQAAFNVSSASNGLPEYFKEGWTLTPSPPTT
jgi:hypothetical protein